MTDDDLRRLILIKSVNYCIDNDLNNQRSLTSLIDSEIEDAKKRITELKKGRVLKFNSLKHT